MGRYRIFVTHNSLTSELKNPIGKCTLTNQKSANDYGGYFWEKKLSDIMVSEKHDSDGYNFLLNIENGSYRCLPATIQLRYYTIGGSYTVKYTGEFSMVNCKFDLERCIITISPTEASIYNCLDKQKDVDFNMLSVANPKDIGIYDFNRWFEQSALSGARFEWAVLASGTPSGTGWFSIAGTYDIAGTDVNVFVRIVVTTSCIAGVAQEPDPIIIFNNDPPTYATWELLSACTSNTTQESTATWVAVETVELLVQLPDFNGSFSLVSGCPLAGSLYSFTDIEAGVPGGTGICYSIAFSNPEYFTEQIYNGRKLSDVLTELITRNSSDCAYDVRNVRSDFFQINAETVNDNNYVSESYNYWKDPLLFQITDVLYPTASEQASIAMITFKKLMTDLWKMFRVVWWIELDGDVYYLRIEHISAAESSYAYNASTVKGFRAYTYESSQNAYSFRFNTPVQRNIDFAGREITFTQICTNKEVEDVSTELLCADIPFIQGYPDDSPTEAIVICAWDQDTLVWNIEGAISGIIQINAPMSWANLHEAFHRHNAHTETGTINGNAVTFESVVRTKKQDVTIKNCQFDLHTYTMIDTELGRGQIQSAQTDLVTETAKIEVRL